MHYLQGRYPVLEKKILAKNMVQYVILPVRKSQRLPSRGSSSTFFQPVTPYAARFLFAALTRKRARFASSLN